jgi:uncharacterized protein (TIGR02444 family)
MAEAPPSGGGSPFWRFSLQFYRRSGVADACIRLQEEAGVDVNLLLFLLWHALQRRALSLSEVERLENAVGPWRQQAVIPLRTIRRALKSPPALLETGTAEAFRNRVKAVELEAERLQQEAMHARVRDGLLGAHAGSVAEAARANIAAYGGICRAVFPENAVEVLISALGEAESPPR